MPDLIIPVGVSGLTDTDFAFRHYVDGVDDAATVAGLTVTELPAADYRVDGLPAGGEGEWRTLTWEYLPGAWGSYVYPEQDAAPPNVVVPVREAGLTAGDLNLALYLNGGAHGAVLTAAEVGSPGDYVVSGWPTDTPGLWVLVWHRAGVSSYYSWQVPSTVAPVLPSPTGMGSVVCGLLERAIRITGDNASLELRRRPRLFDRVTDRSVTTLLVAAAASAGATQVVLDNYPSTLDGELPVGIALNIAGHPEYTLTQDAAVSADQLTANITPALDSDVSIGESVAVATHAAYSYKASRGKMNRQEYRGTLVRGGEHVYVLSSKGATAEPREGDVVPALGGSVVQVQHAPGWLEPPAFWRIIVGAAR